MRPTRRPDLVRAAVSLVAVGALGGCGGSQHAATPRTTPTTTPAGRTTPAAAGTHTSKAPTAQALRLLDHAPAAFSARYRLASDGVPTVTVDVASTPTAYSLRLSGPGSTSMFVVNPKGSYSCEVATRTRCFLVAKPGRPVPAAVDPGLEKLFRDSLHQLVTHPGGYEVNAVGSCFSVHSLGSVTADTVNKGTYCWSAAGILTKYVSTSGSLTLVSTGAAPRVADIVPPPAT